MMPHISRRQAKPSSEVTFGNTDRVAGSNHQARLSAQINDVLLRFVRSLEEHAFGVGAIGVSASGSHRLLEREARRDGIFARPVHLAENVKRAERDNLDAHSGIVDVAVRKSPREVALQLLNRTIVGGNIADKRKGKVAGAGQNVIARKRLLAENNDMKLVARREAVLRVGVSITCCKDRRRVPARREA